MNLSRSMRQAARLCAVACAALSFGAVAQAAQGPITSTLRVQALQMKGHAAVLSPAGVTRPGQVLNYAATYTNHTAGGIRHLLVTLPIPPGTSWDPSAPLQDRPVQASLDGRHFVPYPIEVVQHEANGKVETRLAVPQQYRALRWDLGDLGAKASKSVRMDVKVLGSAR